MGNPNRLWPHRASSIPLVSNPTRILGSRAFEGLPSGCLQPTEIEKYNPLTWLFHRVEPAERDLRNFSTLILAIGEDGLKSDTRSAVQRIQPRGRTT